MYQSLGTCCGIEVYELPYGAFVDLLRVGELERIPLQHPHYNYPSADWLLDNASDFYVWVSVSMIYGEQLCNPSYSVFPFKMLACYLAYREQLDSLISPDCSFVECGEVWHVCGVGTGNYGVPPKLPKPITPQKVVLPVLYYDDVPF